MNHAFRKPPAGMATALALAIAAACTLAVGQQPAGDNAPASSDPAMLESETAPHATRSLILDLVNAKSRAVAVGERGHILLSEDRRQWRQVEHVPTRSTLTGVAAVGDQVWAVGHDGVILHSADGGLGWVRQRVAPFDPDSSDTHNGVPLLDVLFLDERNGFAIGAYALLLRTSDGGTTWTEVPMSADGGSDVATDVGADTGADQDDAVEGDAADDSWTMSADETEIEDEADPHLNAIARTGDGSLFIVGERGAAFRSTDSGESWQRLSLPYDGSMFGVIGYDGRHVLAFGLRGNVYESFDLGDHWNKVDSGAELSLMGGTGWENGGAALVGANGVVLTRTQGTGSLLRHAYPNASVLSSVLAIAPGGELVLAGESGVATWTPN
jgi:photosystem II stability/assembly factor-like uncharacterized protein